MIKFDGVSYYPFHITSPKYISLKYNCLSWNFMNKRSCVENGRFYQNMIKISNIYVSITVSLFNYIYIYICWGIKHIQHSMLAHPEYNNISINNYYQVILQTFMLAEWLFIACSLNTFYPEVITNFQSHICTINSQYYYSRKDKE